MFSQNYIIVFCCFSTGDLRRANGLLARYGFVFNEGGNYSISVYNMLMKVCDIDNLYAFRHFMFVVLLVPVIKV